MTINNTIQNPPWKNTSYYCHDLPTEPRSDAGKILITGASGYIGGRLVPELLVRGYKVRIMVRAASPEYKDLWPDVEILIADTFDKDSLKKALDGIETAYYLMHSLLMGPKKITEMEKQAAKNFREASEEMDVKQIIYLGGLGDTRTELSSHLRSRFQVGEELIKGKTPVTILRAAIIIGAGSASYEIIEHLVKSLPILLIPRWANNKCQPIAINDVIKYLVGVLEKPEMAGKFYDIGGNQVLTYHMMLKILAKLHNLKRIFIPFPYSNIGFYSYVASLITPVPAQITRHLMEGLKYEVICQECNINDILPFKHMSFEESVIRAMNREDQDRIYNRWSNAYPPAHELAIKLHELDNKPMYTTSYSLVTVKKASSLFQSICRVGGKEGWFSSNWMWYLRGLVDRIFFGVGMSRGRRSLKSLKVNDVIGFWRVEILRKNSRLLLRAEMKLPGKAWLEFLIQEENSKRKLSVIPYYYTTTFFGKIYWYVFLPFHEYIFNDLIKQIEKRS